MYLIIIAIGWLYVVVLMAATQPTWLAALFTLLGYGLLPLAIVLYLLDAPRRARRRRRREAQDIPTTPTQHAAGTASSDVNCDAK